MRKNHELAAVVDGQTGALAALVGGNDKRYLASPTNTRQRYRLNLRS